MAQSNARSASSGIFWKYRAIFISVLIFLACDIGILVPTIYSSQRIAGLAVSINLGGRQRMLSQRTAKTLLYLQSDVQQGGTKAAELKELALVVDLFDTTLKGFRDGGMVTGGDGKPTHLMRVETPKGRQIVDSAFDIWNPYLARLQPLLENADFSQAQLEEASQYARANNLTILGLMNDLTSDLERTARRQTEWLWWIQIVGLVFVLVNVLYTVLKSISDLVKGDRALSIAQKETGEILGTVREGLFLIDRKYLLGSQYSKSVSEILRRRIVPEMPFFPMLKEMVEKSVYDSAKDYIELLLGDRVKESLVMSLNPLNQVEVRDTRNSRIRYYLKFNFNRALDENGHISHLLVTVQDVTELVELNAQLEAARGQTQIEIEALLKILKGDPVMLRQFLDNTSKGLTQINQKLKSEIGNGTTWLSLINQILGITHGIKGEAAALNIEMLEKCAHDFEKELIAIREHGEVGGEEMVRITVLLDGFYDQLALITNIVDQVNTNAIGERDAGEKFLQSFTDSLQNLVARIASDEHKEVKVVCELDQLARLPRPVAGELHDIAIQLLRNAVRHGIEKPDDRTAENKPASGEIHVGCRLTSSGDYEFRVRDDGCGIDVNRIRDELVQKNIISRNDAQALDNKHIIAYLFAPGFSMAKTADRNGGHGIGLDVVARKIRALRGRLWVNTEAHRFTDFRIRLSS